MTVQCRPRVFISYSHDTIEHQERVLCFANRLRADGIDAELDLFNNAPRQGWPMWCERNIATADFVLMVCTETYYRRVNGDEEQGKGWGVVWEARIIRQLLYDSGSNSTKFVPVLFSGASPEHIPTPIKGGTHYVVDTDDGYEDLYGYLTRQPRHLPTDLGTIREIVPTRRRQWPTAAMEAATASAPSSILGSSPGLLRPIVSKLGNSPHLKPTDDTSGFLCGNHRRIVCSKITANNWLETEHINNPYRSLPDPTDTEVPLDDLKMHAFLWLPGIQYLKNRDLSSFTPVAAVCTPEPDSIVASMEALLGPDELEKLKMKPGKVHPEDREKIFTAIGMSLGNSFVVMVTIPKLILCIGRNNHEIAYSAILDLFLLPLLEMHRNFYINDFNIYLPDHIKDCETKSRRKENNPVLGQCKKISKAVFSSGSYSVSCIKDIPHWQMFQQIAHFVAWAVGSYHNSQNNKWISLLENTLAMDGTDPSHLEEPAPLATPHAFGSQSRLS